MNKLFGKKLILILLLVSVLHASPVSAYNPFTSLIKAVKSYVASDTKVKSSAVKQLAAVVNAAPSTLLLAQAKPPVVYVAPQNSSTTVSDAKLLSLISTLLNKPEFIAKLRGLQGPQGSKGDPGTNAMYPGQPAYISQPSSPPLIPLVFGPVGIVQPDLPHNFSGASFFTATELLSDKFTANIAKVSNLTVSGATILTGSLNAVGGIRGDLLLTGNQTVSGNLTVNGDFISPGTASQTLKIGTGASASSPNSIAIGIGAAASDNLSGNNIVIGNGAFSNASTSVGGESVIIGNGASSTGLGEVVIGYLAAGCQHDCTVIGFRSVGGLHETVAIGGGANAGISGVENVIIGDDAMVSNDTTFNAVSIGRLSRADNRSSAYGHNARAQGGSSIAIGAESLTNAADGDSIVIGNNATSTAGSQLVIGATNDPIKSVYIGSGVTSTAPQAVTWTFTDASGTNIASRDVTFQTGRSTGTGVAGQFIFAVSNRSVVSGSGTNSQATRLTIGSQLFDVNTSGRFTGQPGSVLTGTVDPTASTTVTGVGTLFTTELIVGDRITISGETRTVTAIASNTSLTVDTAFSDNANDTSPDKLSAILVTRLSNGTTNITMNNLGNVGIGTVAPAGLFHISSDTAALGQAYLTQANGSLDSFDLNFRKARGTGLVPTVITTADELGVINFTGYGGASGYVTGAAIKGISSGTIADTRIPGFLSFWTGTDATPSVLTERMRIDNVGNMKLAGTATRATTEGTNHLDIFDGTAPVGTLANGISLYSTAGELRVMDSAGNATLLSPHENEHNYWVFDSVNQNTGKSLLIDMELMMKSLNATFGWDYVHETLDGVVSLPADFSSSNESFFKKVLDKTRAWLADTTNGITDIFANVLNAKEKICVDGECLNKEQIKYLIDLAGGAAGGTAEGGGDVSNVSSTSSPVITITGDDPAQAVPGSTSADPAQP